MPELTITMPYYNNAEALSFQLGTWWAYPRDIRENLKFIVVDDGSPKSPAHEIVRKVPKGMNLSIYRIEEDRGWNYHGARNLAMDRCETDWALITDIDHALSPRGARALVEADLQPDTHYGFYRRWPNGSHEGVHATTVLVERDAYWAVGGVDEDFVGTRGGDNGMRQRLRDKYHEEILGNVELLLIQDMLRNGRTPDEGQHVRGPEEKTKRNRVKHSKDETIPPTDHIRFEWRQVV